ncbi:transmembrane/coiled-coil protein (DUF726) [Citrus sinensis]|nr:transmembrane/coiled-coil protein (DUF726) [Citrus sinensis]
MTTTSFLSPTQRYAAGALFAIALHQAQNNQTRPLGLPSEDDSNMERSSSSSSSDSVAEDPELWVHENSGLLRPVFRFLDIDSAAWSGLEETAGCFPAKHHIGAFLRLLSEEAGDGSAQSSDQEFALSKAVDATAVSLEADSETSKSKKEKHREYENECREKCSTGKKQSHSDMENADRKTQQETDSNLAGTEDSPHESGSKFDERPIEEEAVLSYQRKVTVLYELLSACLADIPQHDKKCTRQRTGYDSRHRVALRLLATWLDIKWIKMEAVEMMVASSAMAVRKAEASKEEEATSSESKWAKWKRGGIIGAAALTGGTLMAITGGLAAPAIAAGFSALAPTLGTLIPVIGASGFAAAASAAGTVAGSVAVAASFGAAGAGLTGSKMARRIGSVDEFEFKAIGENQNQGWESKNLIAVSTAIQDWLTSRIAMELMKQGAMMTVLKTLLAALAWPATLVFAADLIDSKWTIAVDRSDKAGKLLAEVLMQGLQGYRPVTLIGYSLGARVIFKCLENLAENECNAGIVERVVLLGAPISIKDQNWEAVRKMVAGRFINCYATNDWTLAIAFRASLLSQGLAGIQPINGLGIENIDVTHLIEGHSSYLWASQLILERLELDTYYPVFRRAP